MFSPTFVPSVESIHTHAGHVVHMCGRWCQNSRWRTLSCPRDFGGPCSGPAGAIAIRRGQHLGAGKVELAHHGSEHGEVSLRPPVNGGIVGIRPREATFNVGCTLF
jgi:hypothetical protein